MNDDHEARHRRPSARGFSTRAIDAALAVASEAVEQPAVGV